MAESKMTKVEDPEATRDARELALAVGRAETLLGKSYLSVLGNAEVASLPNSGALDIDSLNSHVRFFNITQLVLDKSENMRDKLATVFQSVHAVGASFLMLVNGDKEKVTINVGVRYAGDQDGLVVAQEVLASSLVANFPGVTLKRSDRNEMEALGKSVFEGMRRVATVTDVPGLRFEDETKERKFMQGVEKLVDAMRGEKYTMLVIADPISSADLAASRRALENLYSNLVPFGESQFTAGASVTDSISKSISKGVTESINRSVTNSAQHTVSKSTTVTASASETTQVGVHITPLGVGASGSQSLTLGVSRGVTRGTADTSGVAVQLGTGVSEALTEGEQKGRQKGTSTSLQIKFENHTVMQLLDRIKRTLKRYDECGDLGMWNCAAYFMSDKPSAAQMAASVYHALVRGEDSSLECGGVTMWDRDRSAQLVPYLQRMEHPRVAVGALSVTPGTLVSSAELAIGAGLPNRSVPGVSVLECAEFGRTVSSYGGEGSSRRVELGRIFNMHREEALPVNLDAESLASHVFVTGSTGCGKSNTVYVMLENLLRHGVDFLVVEPAKGEYRRVFGGRPSGSVYGTNPSLAPLLRINPFSFPHGNDDPSRNIHILEHLDRLVEIFNVCWPMYAAMPAVLKEAMEKSYEDCGWNLTESTNSYEGGMWQNLYPTFADVTRNIRRIIDSSEYDAENKGAYKGSLITRLKSLTNGINGLVFTTDEIPGNDLFDENVIVDLSRVGSIETKALIMGLLVLKLQEHRMTKGDMNAKLRHVTILEEAHNLLKRTSTEQSQDSGNLLGKSVEMLANSIAEMRTYGEGFVIADQAPGLLDMAAIRNTNTKIVMRLPDQGDRELVGKAMHLNDDQIAELAKLPRGVAAVYQNEWVESVLCKVDHYIAKDDHVRKSVCQKGGKQRPLTVSEQLEIARLMFSGTMPSEALLKDLKEGKVRLSARSRILVAQRLKDGQSKPQFTKAGAVVAEVFPESTETLRRALDTTTNKARWTEELNVAVTGIEGLTDDQLRKDMNQAIITEVLLNEMGKRDEFNAWYKGGFLK